MVLELTRQGEIRANEGTLVGVLSTALHIPKEHIFVPATTYSREGARVTVHLMEGYVFVVSGLPDAYYFALERNNPYINKVLSSPGSQGIPVLNVIKDRDVQEMRQQLRDAAVQDISEGMCVRINQGVYGGLLGEVVGMEGNDAFIHVKLRSFEIIRTIPKMFLEPVSDDIVS